MVTSTLAAYSTDELQAEIVRRNKCDHKLYWDNMYRDVECEGRKGHEGLHYYNVQSGPTTIVFLQWK